MKKNEIVKQQKNNARKTCNIFPSSYSSHLWHFSSSCYEKFAFRVIKKSNWDQREVPYQDFYLNFFFLLFNFYCKFFFRFLILNIFVVVQFNVWLKRMKFAKKSIYINSINIKTKIKMKTIEEQNKTNIMWEFWNCICIYVCRFNCALRCVFCYIALPLLSSFFISILLHTVHRCCSVLLLSLRWFFISDFFFFLMELGETRGWCIML